MSQINVSKEFLMKLKASSDSNEVISVLEKFSADRNVEKIRQREIVLAKRLNERLEKAQKERAVALSNKKKKPKVQGPITTPSAEAKKVMEIFGTTTPLSKKEAKRKLRELKIELKKPDVKAEIERKKLARVQAYSKNARSVRQSVGFSATPLYNRSSHNPSPNKYKKEKPLVNTKGNDSYNFAGEYSARNVEFGHGRQKSLEWNDVKAFNLQKELQRLRDLKESDPNTFDREAMK